MAVNTSDIAGIGLMILAMLGPVAYALATARGSSREDFLYNSDDTGLLATFAGIICGNIGVGTFVGIGLFSEASPLIGVSIALAYATGLLMCAWLAPAVRKLCFQHRVRGLVDLLVIAHGVRSPLLIWCPIAFVFLLRAAVQLLALSVLLQSMFGMSAPWSILSSAVLCGGYTAIGGYRVAVRTDIFQAGLIALGIGGLALGLPPSGQAGSGLLDLGPYRWPLLVGVWAFIPVSAILAVDNWQRVVTARDLRTARLGYLLAAPACLAAYLVIAWLGMNGGFPGGLSEALRFAMPSGWAWLADVMLLAVIMSTIDTFVMPLMSGIERSTLTVARMQLLVMALFGVLALAALVLGDLLSGIIAAFSALVAFLPAVIATFLRRRPEPLKVMISLNAGIAATVAFVFIDINTAAFVGLVAATLPFLTNLREWKRTIGSDVRK